MMRSGTFIAWVAGSVAVMVLNAAEPAARPPAPLPPLPPAAASPVSEFRRLLALPPLQRETELAAMASDRQKLADSLRLKLGEYAALAPAEREARLRVLDLRWHLLPMLQLGPEQRGPRLATVPADLRSLVEERLKQWDALPPELRRELLDHEATVRQFLGFASVPPVERRTVLTNLPPVQRQRLQESLTRWQGLPEAQRTRLTDNFQRFFELPAGEKRKTLDALSARERREMEATLKAFEALPAGRRRACLEAFGRFASMSDAEREEFLRNAERWQAMTAAERQTWRSLVLHSPPLPPGFKKFPPLPPSPPVRGSGVSQSHTLTNLSR